MRSNEAIRQQVENLLSQMTLEEKAAQMVQVPYTVVGREEALRWAKLGAGSFLHVLGDDAREVQQAALYRRAKLPPTGCTGRSRPCCAWGATLAGGASTKPSAKTPI